MRVKARLILLSLFAGITVWVFDAIVDMLFFYDEAFLSLLLFDVPLHELYLRTVGIVVFLGFGLTAAWLVGNLEAREADLELFRTLIDEANDSVFVIDPESGELLDVNATACDLLG